MAVTQQVARLSADEPEACRESADALDRLIAFKLLARADYLDLDWAPAPLRQLAALNDDGLLSAVELACFGGAEIHPRSGELLDPPWEPPIRAIERDAVEHVSAILDAWPWGRIALALPADPSAAKQLIGMAEFPEHPATYLQQHHEALRLFYAGAACSGKAVVTWWD